MAHPDTPPLVLLVEDEILSRSAFAHFLKSGGFRVISVADADEALQILEALPEVSAVVTDVEMPNGSINGFQLACRVWEERRIGVVVVSGRAIPQQDELPDGICFVAKPVHGPTLPHLVHTAIGAKTRSAQTVEPMDGSAAPDLEGPVEFTARQREVLQLLMQGKANRDIAFALNLSENTVRAHLQTIFRILGVSNRAAAALAGMRLTEASKALMP